MFLPLLMIYVRSIITSIQYSAKIKFLKIYIQIKNILIKELFLLASGMFFGIYTKGVQFLLFLLK